MAIYHCAVKVIGRKTGRSAVAAAAYRSGEKLINEYDGVEHDFTKKNWIEFTKIMCPENAPEEYQDRGQLWNAVEKAEKSSNAQLAREFELALPREMTREQEIELVETFAKKVLVKQGMVADIAIHDPPVTNDRHQPIDKNGKVTKKKEEMQFINPHAHILCTLRPIDENGKWEKKSTIEYICKKDGEEKAFTANEFKLAKIEGWQKQYLYYFGKKKVYYTASEAEEKGLKRVNRTPKTTRYGRKNPTVEYWNSKECLFEWRKQWEIVVNAQFENMQSDIRIDSRSLKNQGKEDVPTVHMGVAATNMEKRAKRELGEGKKVVEFSDIGNLNRDIKKHNQVMRELSKKLEMLVNKTINRLKEKLEALRQKMFENYEQESSMRKRYEAEKYVLNMDRDRIEKYEIARKQVDELDAEANKNLENLSQRYEKCAFWEIAEKRKIEKQIRIEKEGITNRKNYMKSMKTNCNFQKDEEYLAAKAKYMKEKQNFDQKEIELEIIKNKRMQIKKEMNIIYENLSENIKIDKQKEIKGKEKKKSLR